MLIEVAGAGAGAVTHAFVLGVSHYPFADGPDATPEGEQLGLANLSGAARSASEVAAWLLTEYRNPDAPLAGVTLLLSPVEGEELHPEVVARMGGQTAPATREAVSAGLNAFRAACRTSTDNVAFVYVVGHGIQLNKRGAVVLLHDFAAPGRNLLDGALDVAGCRDAMDENGNAGHQVWFSDACRQRPEIVKRFESLAGAYRLDEGLGQVAASPLFLAASSREAAFAESGGTSIFSQALLWALRGAGATGRDAVTAEWHVPATRLIRLLPERVRELLSGLPEEQQVDVTGRVLEMVVQHFAQPPVVDIEVDVSPADLDPPPVPELLFDAVDRQDVDPSWPLRFTGAAGLYLLRLVPDDAGRTATKVLDVEPPAYRGEIAVAP
jgi:Caspase domain